MRRVESSLQPTELWPGGCKDRPEESAVTERLYYADPYLTDFEAVVSSVELHGTHEAVVLTRTAFYPTSGGQPNDTGRLDDVPVVDVVEREDGAILHITDGRLEAGRVVRGVVNRERRFDHMQQHTGQHILSAAFDRLSRARTVGFHLGAAVSSLDLDRELPAEAIAAAEDEANRVVWENRPVTIRFVSEQQARTLNLRKETERTGEFRLIAVEEYDLSACGGTHVARSGEVGIITVASSERLRGGLRLEFLCGKRVLGGFRRLRDSVAGCIRHLSVSPEELPAAVERAQAENKDLRKTIRAQQERLAGFEAGALAARAEVVGTERRVIEILDGWDANGLKAMAIAVAASPGYQVALFSASAPALAVIARSKDSRLDARAALAALLERFGGKGGGKPDLAQGGGLMGDAHEILQAARTAMADATGR
jgi:alanyl-tRNA synthetase